MANLSESPIYETGVFKLAENTPVLGGDIAFDSEGDPIAGHSNVQGQQLANRTAFLKQSIDNINQSFVEPDPFTQYILRDEIGVPNGVCDLDENGIIPPDRIPALETGEVNSGVNLGAGEGIFTAKMGFDLEFKSLVAGNNVTLSSTDETITINAQVNAGDLPGIFIGNAAESDLANTLVFSDAFTLSRSDDSVEVDIQLPPAIEDTDELPEGTNNLYFTNNRVQNTVIGTLGTSSQPVTITDTIPAAVSKVQNQVNTKTSLATVQAMTLLF